MKLKIQTLKQKQASTLGSEGKGMSKNETRLETSEMDSSRRMVNALLENDRKVMQQIRVGVSEK